MDLTIEQHGGVLAIALSERLDMAASTALAEALEDTIVESDRAVILDFAGVHLIGSAGLRVVLSTAAQLEEQDTKLVLCNLFSGVTTDSRGTFRQSPICPVAPPACCSGSSTEMAGARKRIRGVDG